MQSIIVLVICILSVLLVAFIYYVFIYKPCSYSEDVIYITDINTTLPNPSNPSNPPNLPNPPNPPPYESNEEEPPPYREREFAFSDRQLVYNNRLNQNPNNEIHSFIIL